MSKSESGFQRTIRRSFLLFFIVPISLLVVLFCVMIIAYSSFSVTGNNKKSNQQSYLTAEAEFNAYQDALQNLAQSPVLHQLLQSRLAFSEGYSLLYETNNSTNMKGIFYVLKPDFSLLLTNAPNREENLFGQSFSFLAHEMEANPGQIVFDACRTEYTNAKIGVLLAGCCVRDEKGNRLGYVVYHLLEKEMAKLVYTKGASITTITDRFDNVILTTAPDMLDSMNKFRLPQQIQKNTVEIEFVPYTVAQTSHPVLPFKVTTLASLDAHKQLASFVTLFAMVSFSGIALLGNLLAGKIAKKNSFSAKALLQGVKEFQKGNLSYNIQLRSGDEFEELALEYNQLTTQLHTLLETNLELTDRKRLAEIKQLEAQFNPHFIFNVLETLKYFIMIDPARAGDIVVLLANILRYSIDYTHSQVTLEDDMRYIRDYLTLQKIRYGEKLDYCIDIHPEILSCRLPKLIIQPLVENCINHGYHQKDRLFISITGHFEQGMAVIEVQDNGDGINEETMQKIKEMLQGKLSNLPHIGLYNVHRRLQLVYGAECGLGIQSTPGVGTCIIICMPQIREGRE